MRAEGVKVSFVRHALPSKATQGYQKVLKENWPKEFQSGERRLFLCAEYLQKIETTLEERGLKNSESKPARDFQERLLLVKKLIQFPVDMISTCAQKPTPQRDASRMELAASMASDLVGQCSFIAENKSGAELLSGQSLAQIHNLKRSLEEQLPFVEDAVNGTLGHKRAYTQNQYRDILLEIASKLGMLVTPIRSAIEVSKLAPDAELCRERANEVVTALYEIMASNNALSFIIKGVDTSPLQLRVERSISEKEEILTRRAALSISDKEKLSLQTMGIASVEQLEKAEEKLASTQVLLEKELVGLKAAKLGLENRLKELSHSIKRLLAYAENGGYAPNETLDTFFNVDLMTPRLHALYESDHLKSSEQNPRTSTETSSAPSGLGAKGEDLAWDDFLASIADDALESPTQPQTPWVNQASAPNTMAVLDAKLADVRARVISAKHQVKLLMSDLCGWARAQTDLVDDRSSGMLTLERHVDGLWRAIHSELPAKAVEDKAIIPFAESHVVASVGSLADKAAALKLRVESKCASARANGFENSSVFAAELEALRADLAAVKASFDGLEKPVRRRLGGLMKRFQASRTQPFSASDLQRLIATLRELGLGSNAAQLAEQKGRFKASDVKASGKPYQREDHWTMQNRRSKAYADLDATWKNLQSVIKSTEAMLYPQPGLLSYIW